jgi:HK97 gp10 family phage protein
MIEFSVTSNGLEFNEVAQKISGPLKQKLIERVSDIAWAKAFYGAPVKTGYLASTIYKQISVGEGTVGIGASYGKFVVEGTAPHEIHAPIGGVLSFMVAEKRVFTPIVHHPGTKANPFMQKAVDEAQSKVDETFAELWLELVGG